jgi:hypothetical protein
MKARHGRALGLAVLLALGACAPGPEARDATLAASVASSEPSPTPTVQDVMELADFAPLEPGTYFIDPDDDRSTPLRVVYEVTVEGWSQWIGAAKFSDRGHVGASITTVTNLVRDGCRDHRPADPRVGPGVDDLATALADLAPFRVTSPPTDVTVYGYRGKHLELTVPDLRVEGEADHRRFADCLGGDLHSWIGTPAFGAFYGYNAEPGFTEEFWILDVDGTRVMIAAERSPSSPAEDVSELRAILDSIRIEP